MVFKIEGFVGKRFLLLFSPTPLIFFFARPNVARPEKKFASRPLETLATQAREFKCRNQVKLEGRSPEVVMCAGVYICFTVNEFVSCSCYTKLNLTRKRLAQSLEREKANSILGRANIRLIKTIERNCCLGPATDWAINHSPG